MKRKPVKIITRLVARFDQLDTTINRWLVAHSIALLRISLGGVFLGFGIVKFFLGVSPIEELATRTTTRLTLGVLSGHRAMDFVAGLVGIIGVCFLTGRLWRVGVWLMGAQRIGAMSPLLLFPAELFPGPLHAPSLGAQYILKDIILIAAGMVIAWTGARLVAHSQSLRPSLRRRIPRVERPVKASTAVLQAAAKATV